MSMPSSASTSAAASARRSMSCHATTVHAVPAPADHGVAELDDVLALGHVALHSVERLVLEDEDGVVRADRRSEQALGVGRRRRHDDADARRVHEVGLGALAVLGPEAAAARCRAHHERQVEGGIVGIAPRAALEEHLVARAEHEVAVLQLGDGPQPAHRHAHCHPDDEVLRDGRVEHPPFAVLVVQATQHTPHAAVGADVLAEHHHVVVAGELLVERLPQRVGVPQLAHQSTTYTTPSAVAEPTSGWPRKNASAASISAAISASSACHARRPASVASRRRQRILGLQRLTIVGAAVALRVAQPVAGDAHDLGLDERRALAGTGSRRRGRRRVVHRRRRRYRRPPRRACRSHAPDRRCWPPMSTRPTTPTARHRCSRRRR